MQWWWSVAASRVDCECGPPLSSDARRRSPSPIRRDRRVTTTIVSQPGPAVSRVHANPAPATLPLEVVTGTEPFSLRLGAHAGRHSDAALIMAGVHKSFGAGVPGCSARARVLVDATLRVYPGEVVGVAGGAGVGKSTLLLCAAGLLCPDRGSVAWFGARVCHRNGAAPAASYLPLHTGLAVQEIERALAAGTRLLLLDHAAPAPLHELRGALGRALAHHQAAAVIASRDHLALARLASRIVVISDGRLHTAGRRGALPAERQRKRSAARASSEFPSALARSRIRSTCGRSFRSPQ